MQIGGVSAASFSYARDEAERAYLRALELCDLISAEEGSVAGLDVQLIAALGGLWSKEVVAGDLAKAAVVTDRLERVVHVAPAELAPEIRRFMLGCRGFEQLFAGHTTDAIATLRAASTMNVGPVAVPLGTPHDYVAAVDALLAAALALAGDDVGADASIANALRRTTTLPFPIGPFSEAVVRVYSVVRRAGSAATSKPRRRDAVRIGAIGDRHGFREHSMLGQILLLAAASIPRRSRGLPGAGEPPRYLADGGRRPRGARPARRARRRLAARRRCSHGPHRARRRRHDDGRDGPAGRRARGAPHRRAARPRDRSRR